MAATVLEVATCPNCGKAENFRHLQGIAGPKAKSPGKAYDFWACKDKECGFNLPEYGGVALPPADPDYKTMNKPHAPEDKSVTMRESYIKDLYIAELQAQPTVNPVILMSKVNEVFTNIKAIARGLYKKDDAI